MFKKFETHIIKKAILVCDSKASFQIHNSKIIWYTNEVENKKIIMEAEKIKDSIKGKYVGVKYNNILIPFTKIDTDGVIAVKEIFTTSVTKTTIEFSNGSKLPITKEEFNKFYIWFLEKRSEFFNK